MLIPASKADKHVNYQCVCVITLVKAQVLQMTCPVHVCV